MDRRGFIIGLGASATTTCALQAKNGDGRQGVERQEARPARAFDYDDIVRYARESASHPFNAQLPPLPEELGRLDYDAYRDIRFRPERALFAEIEGSFRLEMFHLGSLYKRPVSLNILRNGKSTPIHYSADFFDYGKNQFRSPLPRDLGYAGFRLHFPLNTPKIHDEVIAFLGASYFRFLGRSQVYGLSARGLAIEAGGPEEFPAFREFWIENPTPGAQNLTIFARLDSPSITGAYRFFLEPGEETTLEVTSTLFARQPITRLGVAPLTSMFLVSESEKRLKDFRPAVHDSDGLQIQTLNGDWIWRPLRNPASLSISSFMDGDAKGFGLMQRERDFEKYVDLEAHYELRPSYWVEPLGKWGEGHIELVEIPTDVETNDNIVCFWTSAKRIEAGQSIGFSYRVTALIDNFKLNGIGVIQNSFLAKPKSPTEESGVNRRQYVVDFSLGDLAFYMSAPDTVEVVATTSSGQVTSAIVRANPHIKGFRVIIEIIPEVGKDADLRAYLKAGSKILTETWTVLWKA